MRTHSNTEHREARHRRELVKRERRTRVRGARREASRRKRAAKSRQDRWDAGVLPSMAGAPNGAPPADPIEEAEQLLATAAQGAELWREAVEVAYPREDPGPDADGEGPVTEADLLEPLSLERPDPAATEPVRWLWDGRIALGKTAALYGQEGGGKGLVYVRLAAELTHGRLVGCRKGEPSGVLIVTIEDDADDALTPRLMAAGADLDRIRYLRETGLMLPRDTRRLCEAAAEFGASLIVIDPLETYMDPSRINVKQTHTVQAAMNEVTAVLREYEIALLGAHHTNRADTDEGARGRAGGSIGYVRAHRSQLLLGESLDDPTGLKGPNRMLGQAKANDRAMVETLILRIDSVKVETGKGPAEVGCVTFGGESPHTADDIANARRTFAKNDREREALALLRGMLPCWVAELDEARDRRGIGKGTLDRARRDHGVKSDRRQRKDEDGKTVDAYWAYFPDEGMDI